jgi:hypothetical protein
MAPTSARNDKAARDVTPDAGPLNVAAHSRRTGKES